MAKEFDIYLRNRLVECDLLVYSIPYRDGISVTNRLILEAALNSYLLRKAVTANMGLEVDAHIDQMIKLCFEKLSMGIGLSSTAEVEKHVKLYLNSTPIIIDSPAVMTMERILNNAESELVMAVEPLVTQVTTSTGTANLPLIVDVSVTDASKRSLLTLCSPIVFNAETVEFNQTDYLDGDAPLVICPSLQSLCYQLTCDASAAIELMTLVLGTEIRHSLGRWYNGIAVDSKVAGTWAQKFIAAQSIVTIMQNVVEKLAKVLYPNRCDIVIDIPSIELVKKRHRLLYEVDDDALYALDDRPLDDIDFVIL